MKTIKICSLFLALSLGVGAPLGAVKHNYEGGWGYWRPTCNDAIRCDHWVVDSCSGDRDKGTLSLAPYEGSVALEEGKVNSVSVHFRKKGKYGSENDISISIAFSSHFWPARDCPEFDTDIAPFRARHFDYISFNGYEDKSKLADFLEVLYRYNFIPDSVAALIIDITDCPEFRPSALIAMLGEEAMSLEAMASLLKLRVHAIENPRLVDAFIAKICNSAHPEALVKSELPQRLELINEVAKRCSVWPVQASLDFLDFMLLQDFSEANPDHAKLLETIELLLPKILPHGEDPSCAQKLSYFYAKIAGKGLNVRRDYPVFFQCKTPLELLFQLIKSLPAKP